jgi:hypothetical protein
MKSQFGEIARRSKPVGRPGSEPRAIAHDALGGASVSAQNARVIYLQDDLKTLEIIAIVSARV